MRYYYSFVLLLLPFWMMGQQFDNTYYENGEISSPRASLDEVSWISGHWHGEAFGGIVEEVWTEPLGPSMMGSFKLVANDKVVFYEILIIKEIEESLILQLKHFSGDLEGWEEKDETVDFKLMKVAPNAVYFNGMTFVRENETNMTVYVVIHNEDGEQHEEAFKYKRHH